MHMLFSFCVYGVKIILFNKKKNFVNEMRYFSPKRIEEKFLKFLQQKLCI